MKNETRRGSTKISMNFKNKTRDTSETNKSFTVCRRPKDLTRMKANLI